MRRQKPGDTTTTEAHEHTFLLVHGWIVFPSYSLTAFCSIIVSLFGQGNRLCARMGGVSTRGCTSAGEEG